MEPVGVKVEKEKEGIEENIPKGPHQIYFCNVVVERSKTAFYSSRRSDKNTLISEIPEKERGNLGASSKMLLHESLLVF